MPDDETQVIETREVDGGEEQVVQADPKIEERAKLQGWVPETEFKGDKARWIPADEFVKRADTVMPILKSQNRKLEEKLLNLDKELTKQREITKKMVKIHGKYVDDFYDDRISNIKKQKSEAVELGDVEKYHKLEVEESKLAKPEKLVIEEEQPQIPPEVARWQSENSHWFGKDQELTEYAAIIGDRLAKQGHSYNEYQFLEVVKEKVKTMFPDKFNGNSNKSSGVDEAGTRGSETTKAKGKTYNDLPADAKAQCQELLATIPGYTKERYLRDYFDEV